MFMSGSYLAFIVLTMVIGLGAQWYVNRQISKFSRVRSSFGMTGAQMAQRMLADHGITNVAIRQGGAGQDHFDPRNNSITLDPEAYNGTSITAIATACHEAGHACQFAQGYTPMTVRGALVPAVNLASNAWVFLLVIGIVLQLEGLQALAIAMYAVVLVFQLVTLPVEFNASSRAMKSLVSCGILSSDETSGTRKVLSAAAMTYVAALAVSLAQLLRLILIARSNNRD